MNRQQLTSGLPVGEEEQCVNFVDSSLISLIEAKIEHSFDFLVCTYPNNKEDTLSVPCKRSLNLLMNFHSEIYGKCMFVDLTSLRMERFPLAYREGKRLHSFDTRACFFIEKHKSVFVKRALKGLQLLLEFQVLKDNKPLTLQVYYDAPRPKTLNIFGGTRRLTMQFLDQISGLNAHVILDTAATDCFVNSSYLDNFGLQYVKDSSVLQLANGEEVQVEGYVKLRVKVQQYYGHLTCVVTKLCDGTDLILGDDWLNKYKAHVDYESKTCVLQKGKRKISLQANPLTHWAPKSSTKCLSAMQFKRAVRKGAMPILFQLTKVDDEETSSQLVDTGCLTAVLEKFKDVFEPLPSGLPPEREMAHTIPLEEGSKPPFRPIYRLSPKELEEAKRQVQEYLEKCWIEPSASPYGSPILFVHGKDGGRLPRVE